ncbi:hypothetical protein Rsub_13359 [Raphidocelis subcapitata]|uniref:Negatively light-regulated protein n=1 Tax=Raphidocelis subcapitata TaxID=307507 RepID=A0A2V0PND2_9CHLO|nr:hypothetical protein Rsub_13359 [Raphidocelis subcapitata]|eukprot:GBG00643.1 hypothetical protein Rsub_13359 [Raphidocelis subcapitata]
MADQTTKSALDIEREQEAMLAKKYGGALKRKAPLMPKDHKFFDSADWALAKEGKGEQPSVAAEESLPKPPAAHIAAHRAGSKLEHGFSRDAGAADVAE